MNMKRRSMKVRMGILLCLAVAAGWAGADDAREAIAKITEEYCASTADQPVTPQLVMEKVKAAAALVTKEGSASFPKFMGKDSEYIFGGTYIWINDYDCVMLMHPVMHKMEGRPLMSLQDVSGKRFFVEFVSTAKDGGGWVQYMWPKPGEKTAVRKVSYIMPAMLDGKEVLVGCGLYDVSDEDLAKLNPR
jgi:methyl-accepting chemotaxis protein